MIVIMMKLKKMAIILIRKEVLLFGKNVMKIVKHVTNLEIQLT